MSSASAIIHTHIKAKQILVSSLIGGALSLMILLPSKNTLQILLAYALRLIGLLLISFIAFFESDIKKKLFATVVFVALNAFLAGVIYFINGFANSSSITVYNGVLYFDTSVISLIAVTALVYLALIIISRIYDNKYSKEHSYRVEFELYGRHYSMSAMADTGNSAKDIFTGKPVIVCTGIKLYTESSSVRPIPIPYSTISGEGILLAYKPDYAYIIDENETKRKVTALVAAIENDCGNERAIFNPCIL